MTFGVVDVVVVAAAERKRVSKGCGLHSRDTLHMIEQRFKQGLAAAFVPAGGSVQRHFSGDGVVGAESGIDLRKLVEAVEHEAGGGNHHHGEADRSEGTRLNSSHL